MAARAGSGDGGPGGRPRSRETMSAASDRVGAPERRAPTADRGPGRDRGGAAAQGSLEGRPRRGVDARGPAATGARLAAGRAHRTVAAPARRAGERGSPVGDRGTGPRRPRGPGPAEKTVGRGGRGDPASWRRAGLPVVGAARRRATLMRTGRGGAPAIARDRVPARSGDPAIASRCPACAPPRDRPPVVDPKGPSRPRCRPSAQPPVPRRSGSEGRPFEPPDDGNARIPVAACGGSPGRARSLTPGPRGATSAARDARPRPGLGRAAPVPRRGRPVAPPMPADRGATPAPGPVRGPTSGGTVRARSGGARGLAPNAGFGGRRGAGRERRTRRARPPGTAGPVGSPAAAGGEPGSPLGDRQGPGDRAASAAPPDPDRRVGASRPHPTRGLRRGRARAPRGPAGGPGEAGPG